MLNNVKYQINLSFLIYSLDFERRIDLDFRKKPSLLIRTHCFQSTNIFIYLLKIFFKKAYEYERWI